MEENLVKIENFFRLDLKIKDLLCKCKPEELNTYNDELGIKYGEKLLDVLEIIKDCFYQMILEMNLGNDIEKIVNERFELYKNKIINSNYDLDKLKAIYKNYFYEMDEGIISRIKNECVGYTFPDINSVAKDCLTINELLHLFHQYVTNNENYYQTMPKIAQKTNFENAKITLYGRDNTLARQIYNTFPLDMSCGYTDILSMGESADILMMVRDKGHALSLEIHNENDRVFVKYFIPKICNVDMVNRLKGVDKVDNTHGYTTGLFDVNYDSATDEIINLIDGVPTDMDMEIFNKK